jgi:hypothetical protein
LLHPKDTNGFVKFKFNTRGAPPNYTYAQCTKGTEVIQIRHNLHVATQSNLLGQIHKANVVLDVPVIADADFSGFRTDDHLDNGLLLTFGEAKHMSAFAELIASFIGLVHELSPTRLTSVRLETAAKHPVHLAPFLYVSELLNPTAQGIVETIRNRGFDIDVYDSKTGLEAFELGLQVTFPKKEQDIIEASKAIGL